VTDYASIQQGLWDGFIDTLDRARWDGHVADVAVPPLSGQPLTIVKLFGELTSSDVAQLSLQASKIGRRRVDVVVLTWQDMQRNKEPPRTMGPQPRR